MAENVKEPEVKDVETKDTTDQQPAQTNQQQTNQPDQKSNEPTVQELMVELAKVKRQADKIASEAAEFKKKYRESLSEVEKASMEKAEKEAEREEQFQQLLRENGINKLEKNYLAMGWTSDEASRMAVAETDGDFDSKCKIMAEVEARKKKEYEAEFLASRPDVNVGSGAGQTVTKEKFDSMSVIERTKLKRENPAEYERLIKH